MKKKSSFILMGLGIICMISAMILLIYTQMEEETALSYSQEIVTDFGQQLEVLNKDTTEENKQDTTESIEIAGQGYMGIILIPQLELELPIADTWSYKLLKQTPCVFSGGLETDDLILAAHNYKAHFGNIKELKHKDEIFIMNGKGELFTYQFIEQEVVGGDDFESLCEGDWDLTLFTCLKVDNTKRTVLRFEKV